MAHTSLDSEVDRILRASTTTHTSVMLPPGRLAPALYARVNRVLTNAGGKWDRQARAHLFADDPRPKLRRILETGASIDEKKKRQAFFTPPELARRLAAMAQVDGCTVLEPSAGEGALALACVEQGAAWVHCVEIDSASAHRLEERGLIYTEADFLALPVGPPVDRVVANPPFAKNQDVRHVERALQWLKPGGILVAVMFPNQMRSSFRRLVTGLDHRIEDLPVGIFREAGTMIAPIVLTVRMPR